MKIFIEFPGTTPSCRSRLSPVANFGPFRYIELLSSYHTRFDLMGEVLPYAPYAHYLA